ncbi:metal-dependent hydrolase [Mycobacterium sp.]|uniref:metal-dependent hydrolase n=1 Tax=Mycobacterium sp. TaxID=1785 RepID=UPI003C7346C0
MTDLQVRRMKFDFETTEVPFIWNPQNPAFSFQMNATSMMIVGFEKMIVAAVREALPTITDPEAATEADAFLRQEAQHASAHRQHVRALTKRYPGLQHTFDEVIRTYDDLTETTSLAFRLAYVADTEATFTPTFKLLLDNEATLFRPGDDRVASLLLWHFVEEVEHRSSALIIYDAAIGDSLYRFRVLPGIVKHLAQVLEIVADGVNAHVPLEERKVDARTLMPGYRVRESLKGKSRFGKWATAQSAPPAYYPVPWGQKIVASARILMSQTPFHNPAHEPLPEFADRWFERYERGDDVCHWYSTEAG